MAAAAVAVLLAVAVFSATGGASGRRRARRRPPRSRPAIGSAERRRRAADELPMLLQLTAAAVSAGLPPGAAVAEANRALDRTGSGNGHRDELTLVCAQLRLGADPRIAWAAVGEDLRPLAEPLLLSAVTGAPAAGVLLAAAQQLRQERRRSAEEAAASLSSLLILPLGLCTLPSFLLLGVVPVVLTLAGSMLRIQ